MPKLHVFHTLPFNLTPGDAPSDFQEGDDVLTIGAHARANCSLYSLKARPASPVEYLGLDKNLRAIEVQPILPLYLELKGQKKMSPNQAFIDLNTDEILIHARNSGQAITDETTIATINEAFSARTSPLSPSNGQTFFTRSASSSSHDSDSTLEPRVN